LPVDEVSGEQEYIGRLYERVGELRRQASARLALALRQEGGTAQSRLDRDAAIFRYSELLARLDAAEDGLCFGRLDLRTGERRHIGRIGLRDESGESEPLLIDWRAPAARAFYVATAGAPHGVRRRRHIIMRGRRVTGLDDEVLDREDLSGSSGLTGEAALLAALEATRTGRMGDIVGTLQAEQDAITRSAHSGILVVQGGPGTGKTAVALHRAAYLLYTHRRLAERGVLVVGPSTTFLGYISQVLPGLGETNVLMRTVGEMFPGVAADRAESRLAEEVKGRATMAGVLAAAVRNRQPASDQHAAGSAEIEFAGETLRLGRHVVAEAARRARATRLPHNQARSLFQRHIIAALAEEYAQSARELADRLEADLADALAEAREAIEADLLSLPEITDSTGDDEQPDLAQVRRDLWSDPAVRTWLDDLWPALTPQRLLEELFADPALLAVAAPSLPAAELSALLREPGGWSAADVPLLDEAADLLGDLAHSARSAHEQEQRVAYAQGVLDIAAGSGDSSDEVLSAADLLDAGELAARHEAPRHRTMAERAAADRTWTFGHVIVDEAQELPEMAWRMLARRPGRDHGGNRGPPGRDRPWTAAATVRARDRRDALAAGYHPRRTPGDARRGNRPGSRKCRTARGHRARRPGAGARRSHLPRRPRRVIRRQPRPDQRDRHPQGQTGQGPGVRLGAHRRPGCDPHRIASRPGRPLRGDDPQHHAAGCPAPRATTCGDSCPTAAATRRVHALERGRRPSVKTDSTSAWSVSGRARMEKSRPDSSAVSSALPMSIRTAPTR
jgi:DNA helicase IV